MTTSPAPPHEERLHALDALRAGALTLGLVVHASMAFLPGAEAFWIVHDPHPSRWLGLAFYVPHMFRMLLFFLIAGLFGHLLLKRLGPRRFIGDRLRRITLVFVTFWPVVMAGVIAVAIVAQRVGLTSPRPAPHGVPLTHLWFLYVLTLCYGAALMAQGLSEHIMTRALKGVANWSVGVLTTLLGPVLLAAPLAAALSQSRDWLPWFGVPTPDMSLAPNAAACVAFGTAFFLGWVLYPRLSAMQRWAREWPAHLAVAVAATAICLVMVGIRPSVAPGSGPAMVLYAGLYAWAAWSWTFALVGLALRRLSTFSPVRRYLSDASYWIYLLHLPVIMLFQVEAVRLNAPGWLKLVAVVALTVALLLGAYQLMVRNTWLGAFINGRRRTTMPR